MNPPDQEKTTPKKQAPKFRKRVPYLLTALVALAYFGYWGRGIVKAWPIFFNPEEASRYTWNHSWEKTGIQTLYGAGLLLVVAVGFILYSKYTQQSLSRTLRIAGLRLSTTSDVKDALSSFVLFIFIFTFAGVIGEIINDYVISISSHINASRIPPSDAWPAFFSSIQAGPLEEITLVPFILMLLATVPVIRARKGGLCAVILVAIIARLLFHLYYGPVVFVTIGLWAIGLIALWFTYRNVWGVFLAHSVSNGLAAVAVAPGLNWLFEVKILLILICGLAAIKILPHFFTRFSALLRQRKELVSSGKSTIYLVEEPLPEWEGFKE